MDRDMLAAHVAMAALESVRGSNLAGELPLEPSKLTAEGLLKQVLRNPLFTAPHTTPDELATVWSEIQEMPAFKKPITQGSLENVLTLLQQNYIVSQFRLVNSIEPDATPAPPDLLLRLERYLKAEEEQNPEEKANESELGKNEAEPAVDAEEELEQPGSPGVVVELGLGETEYASPAENGDVEVQDTNAGVMHTDEVDTGDQEDNSTDRTAEDSRPNSKSRNANSETASSPVRSVSPEGRKQDAETRRTQKRFQTRALQLMASVESWRSSVFFSQPVSEESYYEVVKSPTDLRTIRGRIKDGLITNSAELERELQLMFANSIMYNLWNSDMAQWAREMEADASVKLHVFRETEAGRQGTQSPAPPDSPVAKRRRKNND